MDAVVGLLDGVRARGAFVLRMMMDPPWSMSIKDEAPLTLICQTHGRAAIIGRPRILYLRIIRAAERTTHVLLLPAGIA